MADPLGETRLSLAGMRAAGVMRSGMRLQSVVAAATRWMSANYRAESLYKNLLIQRALAEHHNLTVSAVLPEFRVAGSIIDCVVLNGNAHAYEIKTELDSSAKLAKQLTDYSKAFELVSVVTHHSAAEHYESVTADAGVGLLVLGDDGRLVRVRPAEKNAANLEVSAMAKSLRKPEYTWIAEQLRGRPVDVPPVAHFRECLRIGETVSPAEYRVFFERVLRRRRVPEERRLGSRRYQDVYHPSSSSSRPARLAAHGPASSLMSVISPLGRDTGRGRDRRDGHRGHPHTRPWRPGSLLRRCLPRHPPQRPHEARPRRRLPTTWWREAQPLKQVVCNCGRTHDLWASNGAVVLRVIHVDGNSTLDPLPIARVEKRGRAQSHRWYHLLKLPCGNTHRERIDTTEDDLARNFNRAEHLAQHPPVGEAYKALYGFREDAESLHATLDAALWNRRMIAYGAARQTLIMIGFALAQNSLTRWFWRREQAPPIAV